ncbi:AraC family transcriptional regulator [uncultured Psychroserpens sp.]|uniref:helix-turn-helix domain-containing protein n=1 Tax=uncultured Psychroserpens sp. TaxID=255436 RepID=UPI00261A5FD6|nr:helix-turn-helix domain-containing protein [uncultured Psychroserpens sp.]
MIFKILDFLIIINAIQGVIFALTILFSKYFKNTTNIYLGISMLIGVLINAQYFMMKYDWYSHFPKLAIFEDIEFVLLFPVTLLFYYLKFLNPSFKLKAKHKLLYLPFCISVILNLFVGGHAHFKIYTIDNLTWVPTFYAIEYYASILLNIVILIVVYMLLFRNKSAIKILVHHNLKWIKLFYYFHIVLIFTWISLEILGKLYPYEFTFILWLVLTTFFYWVGYIGIFKFRLAQNRYEIRRVIDKEIKTEYKKPSKSKSSISDEDNKYLQEVKNILEHEKIYRNPKLSRQDIAEKLGISVGYLSQVINNNSEKSFSEYINYYRVEDVKKMITNKAFDKYSILSIGLEAGYNSKSAFYTGFKKETGLTPSEYKKRHLS